MAPRPWSSRAAPRLCLLTPARFSLPGGGIEPTDADATAAALREAQEELGIPPADVTVTGALAPVHTVVSNYLITPVIGRAAARPAFRPNPAEVAEVIEAPLSALRDPDIYRRELRETAWGTFDIHYYQFGPYNIWGATARILQLFLENGDVDC